MYENVFAANFKSIVEYKIHSIDFWFIKFIFFNNSTKLFFVFMCFRIVMFLFTFNINCFIAFITIP